MGARNAGQCSYPFDLAAYHYRYSNGKYLWVPKSNLILITHRFVNTENNCSIEKYNLIFKLIFFCSTNILFDVSKWNRCLKKQEGVEEYVSENVFGR